MHTDTATPNELVDVIPYQEVMSQVRLIQALGNDPARYLGGLTFGNSGAHIRKARSC